MKTLLKLGRHHTVDDDPLATTRFPRGNFEMRPGHAQNIGEESQQCSVRSSVDRWRGDADAKQASRQFLN